MATAIEYGLMAAGISLAIVTVVGSENLKKTFWADPVNKSEQARSEYIANKCADLEFARGSKRMVYVADQYFARGSDFDNHGYVPCPLK